jgi:branched-subunit amino acid permease
MFHQPTVPEVRLNNIGACLTTAITLLSELSDTFGTPFVPAISNTAFSLITVIQVSKLIQLAS